MAVQLLSDLNVPLVDMGVRGVLRIVDNAIRRIDGIGANADLRGQSPGCGSGIVATVRSLAAERDSIAGRACCSRRACVVAFDAVPVRVLREFLGDAAAIHKVEPAVAAAEHRLATPKQIVGKSDARAKVAVGRVDQSSGPS